MHKQWPTIVTLLTVCSAPIHAVEVTGNVGWNSEYIFRGVPQSSSSAFAGADLTEKGFYLGTWVGDLSPGVEIDLYGGYRGTYKDFSYGIGGTAYLYTDDFDDDYFELNLSGGYGIFSLDIAIGEYDASPTELDYTFISGTVSKSGFYGTVGLYAQDFDGSYIELGYGNTLRVKDVNLVDWTISVVRSNDIENDLPACLPSPCLLADETSLVLGITRSFGLYSEPRRN